MSTSTYVNLWNVQTHEPLQLREAAFELATKWPGFPDNPTNSNFVELEMEKYFRHIRGGIVKPAKPYSGVASSRSGYSRLTNYNNLP